MEVVPSAVPLSFDVTYDAANLIVAMIVWDVTNGTPVQTGLPIPMTNVNGTNTYVGQFTPASQHSYLVVKSVFTSTFYNAYDPNYASGSETIFATTFGGGGGGSNAGVTSVIGVVNNPQYIYYPDGKMPVFNMFLGDDEPLPLMALLGNLTPLDLTLCTQIIVYMPNADGSFLELSFTNEGVTLTSPTVLGQFVAEWTSMQSELFMVGELQSIDVSFTIAGKQQTIRFPNCISIFQVPG